MNAAVVRRKAEKERTAIWKKTANRPVDSAKLPKTTALTVPSHVISIPWGPDEALALTLPSTGQIAQADIEVIWPDLSNPLVDYPIALQLR